MGANAFNSKTSLYYIALVDLGGYNYLASIDTATKKTQVLHINYQPDSFVLWAPNQ